MIIIGVITTVVVGVLGTSVGYGMNAPELGSILSVAVMGGFIMAEMKRNR